MAASYKHKGVSNPEKLDIRPSMKKPRQSGGDKPKVDWDVLKAEWITTDISLYGLASKYDLSISAVRNHYNKEKWSKELQKFHTQYENAFEDMMRRKAQDFANRAIELDSMILSASEKIVNALEIKLTEVVQDARLEKADLDELASTLKKASSALKDSLYNIRLASDRATEIVADTTANKKIRDYMDDKDVDSLAEQTQKQ